MIDFLQSIHVLPILAHPFLNLNEKELIEFLPLAKEHGLIGMECAYSLYDDVTIKRSLAIAKQFELYPSGGSDFHGANKPDIQLGTGKGTLEVPYEWANRLKELALLY